MDDRKARRSARCQACRVFVLRRICKSLLREWRIGMPRSLQLAAGPEFNSFAPLAVPLAVNPRRLAR